MVSDEKNLGIKEINSELGVFCSESAFIINVITLLEPNIAFIVFITEDKKAN